MTEIAPPHRRPARIGSARGHVRAAGALARRVRATQARRHPLGRTGALLGPLWPLLVYLPLVAGGALPRPDGLAPLAYAAVGYLVWSLLVDAALAPARGLAAHRGPAIAPPAAILAGMLEAAERTGVRAATLLPLALAAQGAPDPVGAVAALALLGPALALALGAGLLFALLTAPWPDAAGGAATALRLSLLPSLVLFPLPDATWATAATGLNPLALWTDTLRALALTGTLPHPGAVLAWGTVGLLTLALALRGLARLAPRLRDAVCR